MILSYAFCRLHDKHMNVTVASADFNRELSDYVKRSPDESRIETRVFEFTSHASRVHSVVSRHKPCGENEPFVENQKFLNNYAFHFHAEREAGFAERFYKDLRKTEGYTKDYTI